MDTFGKWLNIVENDTGETLNRALLRVIYDNGHSIIREDEGYALLFITEDIFNAKECTIMSIYFLPEHRNFKNFKSLIKDCELYAKEQGCDCISGGSGTFKNIDKLFNFMGYTQPVLFRKGL